VPQVTLQGLQLGPGQVMRATHLSHLHPPFILVSLGMTTTCSYPLTRPRRSCQPVASSLLCTSPACLSGGFTGHPSWSSCWWRAKQWQQGGVVMSQGRRRDRRQQ
jgi:hypothetical protein